MKTEGRNAVIELLKTDKNIDKILLEKGAQHKNGGSITILPIVETKGGDITDYISTNIISICDSKLLIILISDINFAKREG